MILNTGVIYESLMSLLSALALRGKYKVSVAHPMGLMLASTCGLHTRSPQACLSYWPQPLDSPTDEEMNTCSMGCPCQAYFLGIANSVRPESTSFIPWSSLRMEILLLVPPSLNTHSHTRLPDLAAHSTCPPKTLLFSLRNSDLLTYELFSVSSLTLLPYPHSSLYSLFLFMSWREGDTASFPALESWG